MKKRVGDVEEFQFIPLTSGEGSRLHITIAVPGWLPPLNDKNDETGKNIRFKSNESSNHQLSYFRGKDMSTIYGAL